MMMPMKYVAVAPPKPKLTPQAKARQIAHMRFNEPPCPSCGRRSLNSCEDGYGVTYQCHSLDCMEMFDAEEIEGD